MRQSQLRQPGRYRSRYCTNVARLGSVSPCALGMDANGFVLVMTEKNDDTEVFKELWHFRLIVALERWADKTDDGAYLLSLKIAAG